MADPALESLSGEYQAALESATAFAARGAGLQLRAYQQAVSQAVVDSVLNRRGLSFAVMFPRQSGKNELQAHIEAYLLNLFSNCGGELVKLSPTWKPQSLNAMRRLERALRSNIFTRGRWVKEQGFIYWLGQARLYFLSGAPVSNIVGATASLLLECDEAQDVQIEKWDREAAPMAASTNATRVFWGTAWTDQTLLARELRLARQAEQADGLRRAFTLTADQVAVEVPAYGAYVAGQVGMLGRSHPLVRTQYFNEELGAEAGMFPPGRRALMQGDHPALQGPRPGQMYALLLDVGGQESGAALAPGLSAFYQAPLPGIALGRRDATALTVVEVDLASLADEIRQAPTYRVVQRRQWVGMSQSMVYARVRALAEQWQVRWLVVDATGIGAGLASFLERALPGRVLPFVFTARSKSKLGWDFLAIIETGRYHEHLPSPDDEQAALQGFFWRQVQHCQMTVLAGPGQALRWGVPDGLREAAGGELVHDDLLVSAALCARLDNLSWGRGESALVPAVDPLAGLSGTF